jgi:hypothetical protein
MMMPEAGSPAGKSAHRPPWWVVACAVLVVTVVAVGGWHLWHRGTHKVSQANAKDDVTRVLDSLVQATGASRQDYTSGVVLQHCDNGFGGYDGWQVYGEGTFEHQSRDSAIAMADTLSGYLRRAGYSDIQQTRDAHTIRVAGVKDDIEAALSFDTTSSSAVLNQQIHLGATTKCDIVPDPAVATTDQVKIG